MSTTSDRNDPRLTHGADTEPTGMAEVYLVLSEEERAKGFVRPVRRSYRHVGIGAARYPLRDLDEREAELYGGQFTKFEQYPGGQPAVGRYWTQAEVDSVGKGCGTVTTMGVALAETYARDPHFYGATYCCGCGMHLKVGHYGEFTWMATDGRGTEERVGT